MIPVIAGRPDLEERGFIRPESNILILGPDKKIMSRRQGIIIKSTIGKVGQPEIGKQIQFYIYRLFSLKLHSLVLGQLIHVRLQAIKFIIPDGLPGTKKEGQA
jgi:hypothetical protein